MPSILLLSRLSLWGEPNALLGQPIYPIKPSHLRVCVERRFLFPARTGLETQIGWLKRFLILCSNIYLRRKLTMKHYLSILKFIVVLACLLVAPTIVYALTWSAPVAMGWGLTWDQYPEAAADGQGNLYVVWSTYPYSHTIMFNRYDGSSWADAQRINDRSPFNYYPDIATGRDGRVHVVWSGYLPGLSCSILYRVFDGASWSPISYSGLPCGGPTVTVDSQGNVYVALRYPDGGAVKFSQWDGVGWSPVDTVTVSGCNTEVSMDNNDLLYLAYCDSDGSPMFRTLEDDTWSEATHLLGYCGNEYTVIEMFHPADEGGDLVCLGGPVIRHWHKANGVWQVPIDVTASSNFSTDVAIGPNGVMAAIWTEGAPEDAYVSIWSGLEWLPAENVSNTPLWSKWNTVGITSENNVVAIWSENQGGEFPYLLEASAAHIEFNQPPTGTAGGPYTAPEGGTVA